MFDLNDETAGTNINGYLISHLYVTVVAADETTYNLPFESLKKLFTKLQREDVFT